MSTIMRRCLVALLCLIPISSVAQDEEAPPRPGDFSGDGADIEESDGEEDPEHEALRALRDKALKAYNDQDIDTLLTCLHSNVVVTFQNAEVARGHDGVRDFYERMREGDSAEVENLESEFSVDELSILHGEDTAIAFGGMNDEFELANGMDFSLESRWSATLVKENGEWKVASLHASTNMFDNGVSDLMLGANTAKYSGIGGVIGILLGLGIGFFVFRSRQKND